MFFRVWEGPYMKEPKKDVGRFTKGSKSARDAGRRGGFALAKANRRRRGVPEDPQAETEGRSSHVATDPSPATEAPEESFLLGPGDSKVGVKTAPGDSALNLSDRFDAAGWHRR